MSSSSNEQRIKSVIGSQRPHSIGSSREGEPLTVTVNLPGRGQRGRYRGTERPRSYQHAADSYVPTKTDTSNSNNNGNGYKRKVIASSGERDIFDLKFAKMGDEAIIPSRKSSGAGGLDLYSPVDGRIDPGQDLLLDLKIAAQIPEGYIGDVRTRSSIATKNKVDIPTGTIDSDYRGSINVYLRNCSESEPFVFKRGDRVAQMTLTKIAEPNPVEVSYEELTKTERGTGGIGSTGINDNAEQKKTKNEFMAAEPKYRIQTGGPIINYF
jgi:dUTP pyrophosphatase